MDNRPFVSGCCVGEICAAQACGAPAEHKVEEVIFYDDPHQIRHQLTAYLCHFHFQRVMGAAADRRYNRWGKPVGPKYAVKP